MAYLFCRRSMVELAKLQIARYSQKPDHWTVLAKQKTGMHKALKHFDEFYSNVYGKSWQGIRSALLEERHKYMAVVNNFSDIDRTKSELESIGAMNIKTIYEVYKKSIDENRSKRRRKRQRNKRMGSVMADVQASTVQSLYPADYESVPASISTENDAEGMARTRQPLSAVQMHSIDPSLSEVALDENRIVQANVSTSGLHEFVPATRIKGMDDWVLESEHYNYYNKSADFSVDVEEERAMTIPEHLNIYTFEESNDSMFPSPKKGSTGVLDYYLLDGASVLPVLALDIQPSDAVLDMCAAPGGKALTILQTLQPQLMIANDLTKSRVRKLRKVLNEYLDGIGGWHDKLFVTKGDARLLEDRDAYNKILVDVPCTTDRHVLHSNENNIFKMGRTRERLQMPEMQANILTNALKLISVGGTVVYSTCSLSPIQNDGVVGMALKQAWEETNSVMVVKDMTEALRPLECLYKFGDFGLKYGHIAIPTLGNNWGPMYFCKIVRLR